MRHRSYANRTRGGGRRMWQLPRETRGRREKGSARNHTGGVGRIDIAREEGSKSTVKKIPRPVALRFRSVVVYISEWVIWAPSNQAWRWFMKRLSQQLNVNEGCCWWVHHCTQWTVHRITTRFNEKALYKESPSSHWPLSIEVHLFNSTNICYKSSALDHIHPHISHHHR